MTLPQPGAGPTGAGSKREAVLRLMSASAFLIFFQAYLVAPLIPSLSIEFHASTDFLGMLVPAYMLPYGISTLFYGPISDRFGRKPVILALLGLMVVTTAGVATAHTAPQMMIWRLLGGAITEESYQSPWLFSGIFFLMNNAAGPGMDIRCGGRRHGFRVNPRGFFESHHRLALGVPYNSRFRCSRSGFAIRLRQFLERNRCTSVKPR